MSRWDEPPDKGDWLLGLLMVNTLLAALILAAS